MNNICKSVLVVLVAFLLVGIPQISQAAYTSENGPNGSQGSAQSLDVYFSSGINYFAEIDSIGTLSMFSATVLGTAGDNTFDYYSFNIGINGSPLTVGVQMIFDIDYAQATSHDPVNPLDTNLELYDVNGTILASNDNSSFNGSGDLLPDTYNSFLSYTYNTEGLYFVRISQFHGGNSTVLSSPGSYHLHVSAVPLPSSILLMMLGIVGFIGFKRKSMG